MYQSDGSAAIKTKKVPFERLRGIAKTKRRKPLTQREIDEAIAQAVTEKYFRVLRQGRSNK
jgi:hypothetical protein